MRYRCTGSVHGHVGDCLTPPAGALLCYGYLDRDQGVPLQESMEGPRPLLFPSCMLHRPQLVEWAEYLWGEVADGVWVEAKGIAHVLRWMDAEQDPVVIAPNPSDAVRISTAV